jgi:anti-sigma B factor antagonist
VVVRLHGDFDMVGVEPFRIEVERARAMAEGPVVIDLRKLEFIDSSGLRAILDGHSALTERGLEVSYLKPPERLWRVFTVTGADRLLPFDDEHAAEVDAAPGGRDA